MKTLITASVILIFSNYIYSQESMIKYDGAVSYVSIKSHPSADPNGSEGILFNSNFYSQRAFSDKFLLLFDHRFYGLKDQNLLPEIFTPFESSLTTGIILCGFGELQAILSNAQYPLSHSFPFPYYQSGTEITPQMLTTIDGKWDFEWEWYHLTSSLTTSIYNFKLIASDPYVTEIDNETPPYGDKRDIDVWSDIATGVLLPFDVEINAGMFLKDDLSGNDHYNINMYWIGLAGDPHIKRNRLMLSYDARERFLTSKQMHENGYADGYATNIIMRLLWRKSATLFIKSAVDIAIAEQLFKQYYEFQLRKTLKDYSFDVTYCATSGVLFPRQILHLGSTLRLVEHFGLAPSASVYMSQLPNKNDFRYYRSDYKLEFLFSIKERVEVFTGATYSHYDRHPLFATRSFISAGIRTW